MSSRLVPFTIAGVICFAAAFFLGAGFWYFLGTGRYSHGNNTKTIVVTESSQNENTNSAIIRPTENNANVEQNSTVNTNTQSDIQSDTAQPRTSPPAVLKKAPAGEILVSGGEVKVTDKLNISKKDIRQLPVRRESVNNFYIGETEVSNAQYAEFIEAVNRKAPKSWKNGKVEQGAENFPVTDITWADANAYCEWLSKEIGAEVRLPTGEEWLRAARGDTDNKYPWGSNWNEEFFKTGKKKVLNPVKNNSGGRSPFGAYEMLGNVWEWTSDEVVDESGKPMLSGKNRQRIIRGCSYTDYDSDYISLNTIAPRPENKPSKTIGFRYVIIRK